MTARYRLAMGVAGLAASAALVRRDRVGRRELRVFRVVNELPDELHPPLWVLMQSGVVGAAPLAGAVAWAAGRPRTGLHLVLSGTSAWLLAKGVKVFVRRPRPVVLLPATHCRGAQARGLGYVSGHAAVVTALATGALPELPGRASRSIAITAVPAVGLARMYVGAHLPLDVLGGAALGVAADALVSLATGRGLTRR